MEKICRRVLMKNINILHAYSIFSFLLSYFIHLFFLNIYFVGHFNFWNNPYNQSINQSFI